MDNNNNHNHPFPLTVETRATVGGDVQQGLGQNAGPLEALDEDVPLPLGQLAPVPVQQ